jgi:hypothetical protein
MGALWRRVGEERVSAALTIRIVSHIPAAVVYLSEPGVGGAGDTDVCVSFALEDKSLQWA